MKWSLSDMKKVMKWVIPILLVGLLIGSAGWYMFVYDRDTVQDFLTAQARNSAQSGNHKTAAWFYDQAYKLAGTDENVAIELAGIYSSAGNYTKAENTLSSAIADGGDAELYIALCKIYVEQDKLLDAVSMLDNITDSAIKAELDALRPAVPAADYEPGLYNEYIALNFTADAPSIFVTIDGSYPSTAKNLYTEPVQLPAGETRLFAVCVAENGLVSPLADLVYTVGGVVEAVTITDPAIDSQIRTQLLYGENTPLYSNDLWKITEFALPAEAASTEDLKLLTHLKQLTIHDRQLDSLEFLSTITELEYLDLSNCDLPDDLSTIATLPALKELRLSECGISTISTLSMATGLTHLDVSSNAIGDVSVLTNMPLLSVVDLSHNAVTDLSCVTVLPQLTELNVSYNSIASVGPVGVCTLLKKLDITNNQVSDIAPLSALTNLTHFYAGYNQFADANVLVGCIGLQELNISHNLLTDISALSSLVNLVVFDFSHNEITALPALPSDCALHTVNGEYNQMEDVSVLGGMVNLAYVYMDYNNISDISFLKDCSNLVQVNVYGTSVTAVYDLIDMGVIVNYNPTA